MQQPIAEYLRWKLLASIVRWMRMWAPNADLRELNECGDDIRRIAADTGFDPTELRHLVSLGPNAAALMPHMAEALNLDPAAIPPDVLRDLQRVCALCRNKTECACELARGSADTTYMDYCPNADTLRALQLEMEQWPTPHRAAS